MKIDTLAKGDTVTLTLEVTKAELSNHSYYGDHMRYKFTVQDTDAPDAIVEGAEWIEARVQVTGDTDLMSQERRAKAAEREDDADDAVAREDLEAQTVKDLDALIDDQDLDVAKSLNKSDKIDAILSVTA